MGRTPDPDVVAITDALRNAIATQEGNIFGNTEVFLNGTRGDVRTQETNLGNLTADANLATAKQVDSDVVISIKNGGGIRDDIGDVIIPPGATEPEDFIKVPPPANDLAGKQEGDISQLDISDSLRFNNDLTLLTVTASELVEILEHGVAETEDGATPGRFPQVSGIAFSFDDDLPAGDRIQSLAIQDENGDVLDVVVENGNLAGDGERTFRLVTLGFLAGGGDDYPFPDRDRLDLVIEDEDNPTPDTRTGVATFAPDGSEQDALAEYLAANFPTATPFNTEDVSPEFDERIQNLDFRQDTILDGVQFPTDGDDDLTGTDAADAIEALGGNDTVDGGSGDDTIDGGAGDDLLKGRRDNDLISGGDGRDRLVGQGGDDSLFGGTGDDRLWGEAGDDLLDGGDGDDFLRGWAGDDTLVGGSGADEFVIEGLPGIDTIADFTIGEDKIELKGLTFEVLSISQADGNATIAVGSTPLATVVGVSDALSAADFI